MSRIDTRPILWLVLRPSPVLEKGLSGKDFFVLKITGLFYASDFCICDFILYKKNIIYGKFEDTKGVIRSRKIERQITQ
jgi:hypothetical protein